MFGTYSDRDDFPEDEHQHYRADDDICLLVIDKILHPASYLQLSEDPSRKKR